MLHLVFVRLFNYYYLIKHQLIVWLWVTPKVCVV